MSLDNDAPIIVVAALLCETEVVIEGAMHGMAVVIDTRAVVKKITEEQSAARNTDDEIMRPSTVMSEDGIYYWFYWNRYTVIVPGSNSYQSLGKAC